MKHGREDYNRIQDPGLHDPSLLAPGCSPIGESEPVFLLRGRDVLAPEVIRFWAEQLVYRGGSSELAAIATYWAASMSTWQELNGCHLPDMPKKEVE